MLFRKIIAEQFSMIESGMISQINLSEVLFGRWKKESVCETTSPNLMALIRWFNNVWIFFFEMREVLV